MRLRSAVNNNDNDNDYLWRDNDYLRRIEHMLRPETMETILRIFKTPGATRSEVTSKLAQLEKDLRYEARYKVAKCRIGPFYGE